MQLRNKKYCSSPLRTLFNITWKQYNQIEVIKKRLIENCCTEDYINEHVRKDSNKKVTANTNRHEDENENSIW